MIRPKMRRELSGMAATRPDLLIGANPAKGVECRLSRPPTHFVLGTAYQTFCLLENSLTVIERLLGVLW
jgi:hypothetical protein